MSQGTPTINATSPGGLPDTIKGQLWTPPSIDYTFHDENGNETTIGNITRVDFTPHHVVFWRDTDRDSVLVYAGRVDTVQCLWQVQPEDPA